MTCVVVYAGRCKEWKKIFVDVKLPTCPPTTPTTTTRTITNPRTDDDRSQSSHLGTTHLVLAVVGVLVALLVATLVFYVRHWTASRDDTSGASSNERVLSPSGRQPVIYSLSITFVPDLIIVFNPSTPTVPRGHTVGYSYRASCKSKVK